MFLEPILTIFPLIGYFIFYDILIVRSVLGNVSDSSRGWNVPENWVNKKSFITDYSSFEETFVPNWILFLRKYFVLDLKKKKDFGKENSARN